MSGRILTERLLATSSLAALILAASGQHSANAAIGCTATASAGTAFSNSSSIPCIAVTTSAISVTNTASGTIGPPNAGFAAITVTGGGTLSGGIINAGRIAGISSGTRSYGVAVDELVQGDISNSGSIAINTTNAGFVEAYGIDVGENLGGSVTTFAGGLTTAARFPSR